ncbi:GNAT family N-acetyltransferase [Geodermatophilus sp. FMUSA9-8]|uniref:GNAT family N-acetyltransferase n=1 Tax=Geodermatophilus sp. FMUSA9-8 TaxID=3120155 RepID=UPI0030088A6D
MLDGPVGFRPLTRADLPLLGRWLEEPLMARWWVHETTPEALEADFGPCIDGTDPTEVLLALADGRPFGLVQRYRIADFPEYVDELTPVVAVPPRALSIDYLIGEPGVRGGGAGAAMLRAFVGESWAAYPEADAVLVPVAAGNVASWRALERAGFTRVAEGPLTPDNPVDPPDHVVYLLRRPPGLRGA